MNSFLLRLVFLVAAFAALAVVLQDRPEIAHVLITGELPR